jgi:hypothetical protein
MQKIPLRKQDQKRHFNMIAEMTTCTEHILEQDGKGTLKFNMIAELYSEHIMVLYQMHQYNLCKHRMVDKCNGSISPLWKQDNRHFQYER